ncbi:MAG TPA: glutamate--cysteine ligase [Gaiellaceae bacterium]|nr:glutamate--cysteine ligase [Gaiellaceae bacterium]
MEQNYGQGRLYSLGVEEEFQILGRESHELVSRIDEILLAFDDDEEHDGRVKPELLQSVVEVATKVSGTVGEALEDLARLRARLRDVAAESDSLIAAAGTHPFSRYEHQEVTDRPRYRELIEAMRWVAERELIFGLHVHVGLDSPDKAIGCANAARAFLPELLALSVNSPFWQGRPTGLASTRTKVFEAFPRSGLPPAFSSYEEFELLVDRAIKTNSFPDYTYIWWDLRPHPRLGTIELRICDTQTRIDAVAVLVALTQSLVATLAEEWERGGKPPLQPITLVAENKWRAARDGLHAHLIDLEHDTERPAPEALRALAERCEPAARKLGCAEELRALEDVLGRGSGTEEQLRVYEETESLLAVAQWLTEETVRDL